MALRPLDAGSSTFLNRSCERSSNHAYGVSANHVVLIFDAPGRNQ